MSERPGQLHPMPTGDMPAETRHPRERILFVFCLLFSLLAWIAIGIVAVPALLEDAEGLLAVAVLIGVIWLVSLFVRAAFVAHVRGNGLRVSGEQLPHIDAAVERAAAALGVPAPETYVVQYGGVREAATRIFLGSRILVLSNDLVEDQGEGPELDMVIGREVAHFRYHHLRWGLILLPSMILPLLYPAWRRSTEYTADRCGLRVCGDPVAAERAIYITAAGSELGRRVAPGAYHEQVRLTGGFCLTLASLLSPEPNTVWRVSRLLQAVPEYAGTAPAPRRSVIAAFLSAFIPGSSLLRGSSGAGANLLIAVAIIALLISVMLPSLARARELAKRSVCAKRMSTIGVALAQYASEQNGRLPADLAGHLLRAGVPADALRCPSGAGPNYLVARPPPGGYTAATPVLFEPLDNHGEEGGFVLFGDGTVKFLLKAEFERVTEPCLEDAMPIEP
ncbi:MAG TPA: hypothetical protein PKY77_11580 [Phycisphaerae bacterium]|nr:hypothetical protein [Phycisphaerae bacterium]HRY70362.1 hypothetical protein [Phycisphaerae bacterium]HSA28079.1 hypothetical protein [Phycisphaerae bacterium]